MKNTIFLVGGVSAWSWRNNLEYLQDELSKCDGGDITVYIKSHGGSVFEGIDMHNALRAYAGKNNAKVTTVAMGIVASIALFIFLAGDERHAFDNSALMGHNASTFTWGDRHEHRTSTSLLEAIDDVQAKKFEKLQKLPLDTIKQNMTHEMWYMGEEQLLASKLVTKIIKTDEHLDIELPDGVTTEAESDPIEAHKEFLTSFAKESIEHNVTIDEDKAKESVKACYGNCSIESKKVVENPTVNGKQVFNDSKGDNSMDEEQLKELQANYAKSQATIEALNATVGDKDKLLAEKESEITALNAKIEELQANAGLSHDMAKEFIAISANNNLSMEQTIEVFAEKSVSAAMIKARSFKANGNSNGGFGGGDSTPNREEDSTPREPTAEQTEKILNML